MSDEKPALLRIQRDAAHGPFTAVFDLPRSAGQISIVLPNGTAEEHMLEVARDHLHRLLQAAPAATAGWIVADDRRQQIDPTRKQPQTRRPDRPHTSTSWMSN